MPEDDVSWSLSLRDSVTDSLESNVHVSVRSPSCPITSSPHSHLLNNTKASGCTKTHRTLRWGDPRLNRDARQGFGVPNYTWNKPWWPECVFVLSTFKFIHLYLLYRMELFQGKSRMLLLTLIVFTNLISSEPGHKSCRPHLPSAYLPTKTYKKIQCRSPLIHLPLPWPFLPTRPRSSWFHRQSPCSFWISFRDGKSAGPCPHLLDC